MATSEVATYREKFDEIKAMLLQNRSLALLYIDASKLSQIEHDYGSQIYEEVLQLVTQLVLDMRGMQTRQDDLVTVNERHGDVFLIFLSKKREEETVWQGRSGTSGRPNSFLSEQANLPHDLLLSAQSTQTGDRIRPRSSKPASSKKKGLSSK